MPAPSSQGSGLASSSTSSKSATSQDTQDDLSTTPRSGASKDSVASSDTQTQDSSITDESKSDTSKVASSSTSHTDSSLSPTGKTSAEQTPDADPALVSAARAIRRALDDDPQLSSVFVTVAPENGKIVLRGSVKDQSLIKSIEQKAERAAMGKQIDNQIKSGNQ